jgi:AraC family transcriptional activator of mtrCDE
LLFRLKPGVGVDALSRLLSLHPVHAALDIRCRFGLPWSLPHDATVPGIAPYHLILEGRAVLELPTLAPLSLQAGDLVLLPRGAAHYLHAAAADDNVSPVRLAPATASSPVTLRVNDPTDAKPSATVVSDFLCGQFRFDPGQSHALMQGLPEVMLVRSQGHADGERLRTLASLLRQECGGADGLAAVGEGAQAVVAGLASALFGLALRIWLRQDGLTPGLLALLAHPRLGRAVQAMLDDLQAEWTLESLAAVCHMSRASFARQFREQGATTPGELLLQLRMARAAQLLELGMLGTAEIGEAIGYRSEAAFNRVFTKYSGVGPGAFRRRLRATVS